MPIPLNGLWNVLIEEMQLKVETNYHPVWVRIKAV